MDWDRIEGNWKEFTSGAKERWGRLTRDQLEKIAGKRDLLARKIKECYGLTKDDVEKQISDWQSAQKEPEKEAK